MTHPFPDQRWQIAQPNGRLIDQLVNQLHLDPLIAQVMANRSIADLPQAQVYLIPEEQDLPAPQSEFTDLLPSVAILKTAIERGDKIGICGDYDADGMTSTALLMRAFKHLGANADYVIPSRMKDGYGINERIVEELHQSGFKVIVTVDNGIAAYDAIAHGKALGMQVIITDHHDLPEQLPPADTILNPKLLSPHSLYSGLAGVGVAYILAVSLAQAMGQNQGITRPLLELYTLGTIADLAPLIGVNRRWLKRGLKLLPHSDIAGIQALMQTANIDQSKKQLQPDHIGFQLGPRINAVGRIGDPQDVINLLTTDSFDEALKAAHQCEQTNRTRQQLCEQIDLSLLFRWFLDLHPSDEAFDPTTFTKNRQRLLDHDIADEFFAAVSSRRSCVVTCHRIISLSTGLCCRRGRRTRASNPTTAPATTGTATGSRAATPRSISKARSGRTRPTPRRLILRRCCSASPTRLPRSCPTWGIC
ncbi:MAG: hypothetical protein HC796_06705 [Synechococcaceae cyanobacterium RL_1_2]|nr:hypothetical protein [Synechococcaceae cyanobacterium RL_1_2]